jgi:hypothetical protein
MPVRKEPWNCKECQNELRHALVCSGSLNVCISVLLLLCFVDFGHYNQLPQQNLQTLQVGALSDAVKSEQWQQALAPLALLQQSGLVLDICAYSDAAGSGSF